jgi:membrane protein implicated in regulation of membrane protease activity
MFVVVLGMLVSLALALIVLFVVAVPARRERRYMLTPKAEEMVSQVRERTGDVLETAREKTGEVLGAAREKVSDVTGSNQD